MDRRLVSQAAQLARNYSDAATMAPRPDRLQNEQREWLINERNRCRSAACLRHVYANRNDDLIAFTRLERLLEKIDPSARTGGACALPKVVLPKNLAILGAGAPGGKKLDFRIDQSGKQATQMDVSVNAPSKAVALVLGADEPTIWRVRWSPTTRIVAVVIHGYNRQLVTGLGDDIPILNSSWDNKSACGYYFLFFEKRPELDHISRRVFGRGVDQVYRNGRDGNIMIGDPLSKSLNLISSSTASPELFRGATWPLIGQGGLDAAVRMGLIRKVQQADADAWLAAAKTRLRQRDIPPIAGQGDAAPDAPAIGMDYVVIKPFSFPADIGGDHTTTFLVQEGVPFPYGDRGNSTVLDLNTGSCSGKECERYVAPHQND